MLTRIFILLSLLLIVGCSTPAIKKFSEVRVGMEKTDVIDLIGSPATTSRSDGADIWHYRFWDDQNKWDDRIVIIKEGVVTYVGKPLSREIIYDSKDKAL